MPGPAIEAHGLRREFTTRTRWRGARETKVALDGFHLAVAEGQIHGLLGPNGAGKTTLVRILATILLPTAGRVRVLGFDVVRDAAQIRHRIGLVLGGERGLYFRLTAADNLRFWAGMHGLRRRDARLRCDSLLERFGLTAHAHLPVETFSRGMKQRLHLARGLIGDPPLLILDEPTTGMDLVAANELRDLLRQLRAEGRTILLTTHDMDEAESLCDRVSLIDHGRLLLSDSPRTLAETIYGYEYIDVTGARSPTLAAIADLAGVRSVTAHGAMTRIQTTSAEATRGALRRLVDDGVTEVRTGRPGLDDIYLQVFGGKGLRV